MSFKFTETKSSSCLHSYLTCLTMCQAAHSFRGLKKKKTFTALFYTKNKYYNCLVASELAPYLLQKRENNEAKDHHHPLIIGTVISFWVN